MRAIIICPTERPEVAFLSRRHPLVLMPLFGRSVLDWTLAALASEGAKEIIILAPDRPEQVRAAVGKGEVWGVKAEVFPESRELSVAEARYKYGVTPGHGWLSEPHDVFFLDALPQLPGIPLWRSGAYCFQLFERCFTEAAHERVGVREYAPGVFLGMRSQVAPTAKLEAPCWIGSQVWVGPGAVVGPRAYVEDGSYIDHGASVSESVVGPRTYVGAMTDVRRSIAWGKGLHNWQTRAFTDVADDFLLADLAGAPAARYASSWPARLFAALVVICTSPVLLLAWWRTRGTADGMTVEHQGVCGAPAGVPVGGATFSYKELRGVTGVWTRWPELWNVVRGIQCWVGNRPVTVAQSAEFTTDFERLWLAAPVGVWSLADSLGCGEPLGDEARAHASYYAASRSWRLDWQLLRNLFSRAIGGDLGQHKTAAKLEPE